MLNILGLRLGSVVDLDKSVAQHTLFGEVDTSLRDEVLYLLFYIDDGGQDGEYWFLAGLHLLVEKIIYFFVREKSRGTEDDDGEVDVGIFVLDSVDDVSKLFGCSCGEEVDRVAYT